MKISSAFPSAYLKSQELDGDTVYTIDRVEIETLGQGKDAEEKPVVYFTETEKGLALNKTNANTIASLYGDDTDDWAGKPVTLYATEVEFQGKQTLAIRVRMRAPQKSTSKPAIGNGGNSGGNPVLSARSDAWNAFIAATPNWDDKKRKSKWMDAVKYVYPGRAERELTADDWKQVTFEIQTSYSEENDGFIPT